MLEIQKQDVGARNPLEAKHILHHKLVTIEVMHEKCTKIIFAVTLPSLLLFSLFSLFFFPLLSLFPSSPTLPWQITKQNQAPAENTHMPNPFPRQSAGQSWPWSKKEKMRKLSKRENFSWPWSKNESTALRSREQLASCRKVHGARHHSDAKVHIEVLLEPSWEPVGCEIVVSHICTVHHELVPAFCKTKTNWGNLDIKTWSLDNTSGPHLVFFSCKNKARISNGWELKPGQTLFGFWEMYKDYCKDYSIKTTE